MPRILRQIHDKTFARLGNGHYLRDWGEGSSGGRDEFFLMRPEVGG